MLFGIPLFSYILFVSAAITLAIGIYALARADSEIRVIFFMLMIAITAWSFFQGLEMASASMHDKILWAQAEYLGISTTPLLWFLLSINYGSRLSPRMRRVFYLLFVVPIITIVMAFTNSEHHLLWKDFAFAREVIPTVSAGRNLIFIHGPWFWIALCYSYVLLLAGSAFLIRTAARSNRLIRRHSVVIIIGALVPWAANVVYVAGLSPVEGLDITTVSFTASGIFFAWGIMRLKFLNVIPIAHALIVEQMQDGIIVLDDQGCLIEINPQARVIANLRDARQGEKVDLSSFGLTDEMLDCGNPASHSYELTLPAPDERIIEVTCTLIVGSKRRGRGRLITLRDITERRKNEETIRQLFLAVEQSPTSVIITDPNGTIQYVNPIFCAITGYQFSEVIGRNPRILKSGVQSAEVYRDLWQTITSGGTWRGELHNKKKSGELYWELVSISPIVNDRGEITHFVAVKEDITARKLAEEALRKRNEMMEKDLTSAQIMQRTMLPKEAPVHPRLAVAFRYLPLESVGGDFLSFTPFQDGGFGVFIADVSGHGVSAALFVSMIKAMSDRVCRSWGESPGVYLTNMNKELVESGFPAFITAIYGRFDFPDEEQALFRFARGGHPLPVVYTHDSGTFTMPQANGSMVGWFPGFTYSERSLNLHKGDRVFLYTDGFPETADPAGRIIGFEAVPDIIRECSSPSLEETLDRIVGRIREHQGNAAAEDDTIIIGIEIR